MTKVRKGWKGKREKEENKHTKERLKESIDEGEMEGWQERRNETR